MTWLLLGTLLVWLALGPWVVVAVLAAMLVPRLRWWLQDHLVVPRKLVTVSAAVVTLTAGAVLVVPDGWLPIPPGPGVLATPSYLGRPASVRPLAVEPVPQHPHLAPHGAAAGSGDSWRSGAVPGAGPAGLQPQVETAWFGREACQDLAFDTRGRVITVCDGSGGPRLHVVDPESMRKAASLDLPERAGGGPSAELCGATPFYLDAQDRAVVARADRQVEVLRTSDGAGDPDLTVDQTWDLQPFVPDGDCVVALAPDRSGRVWWASRAGLVGTISPESGEVAAHDLGESVHDGLAVDDAGVHVVTDHAVHRLTAGPDGQPQPVWTSPYDRGEDRKPGQRVQGSGTGPTVLDGGVVAFADNADPAMHVVFVEAASGKEICRRAVFEDGASATEASLVSVGDGVVVVNQYGNRGRRSTALGFASEPGVVRVDVAGGDCTVRWTSDRVVPSGTPRASWGNGLVYAYTKRPSWTGVSAWYVTALDAVTGRAMWSARAGTGAWYDNRGASVALAPDGTLWTATAAGLVRVRDRSSD